MYNRVGEWRGVCVVIMKGLGECEPRTGDKTKCYFCFTYALLLRLIESRLLSLNVTLPSERGKTALF